MTLNAVILVPLIIALLRISATKSVKFTQDDFCQLGKNHIFCEKSSDKTLKIQPKYSKVSKEDISTYLFYFNAFRSSLTTGRPATSSKAMMPKAANMQALRWNSLCYKAAFTHMMHCNYDGWGKSQYCIHECVDCKNLGDFDSILFSTEVIGPYYDGIVPALMDVLQKLSYSPKSVQKFVLSKDFRKQDLFQVLANAKLTEIGCFSMRRSEGLGFLLSCVVGDSTDLEGSPVYEEGAPCSICPPKANCSTKGVSAGLCVLPPGVGVPHRADISFSTGKKKRPIKILDKPDYDYNQLSDDSVNNAFAPPKKPKKKKPTTPKSAAKSSRDTIASGSANLGDNIALGGLIAVILGGCGSAQGF